MSDAAIIIEVRADGSVKVKRQLDEITNSAQKTERSVLNLKNAIIAVATNNIVKGLVNMSDSFTRIKTGIENVTKSTSEYNHTFDKLFAIAQKNGVAFETVTKGFTQLNVSLDDTIKSTVDLTKVTDILSRGLAAAGANGNTSAGVMLQFTQGLATNFKAAGQELNSLIEGAPILANAIAVHLGGKSAADLKIMAEAGQLTAKAMLDALIAVEGTVNAFAIPPTVEAGWTRLKNAFTVFMGESQVAQGIFNGLASTLDILATNFDTVTESVIALGLALGAVKLGSVIAGSAFFQLALEVKSLRNAIDLLKATFMIGASSLVGVFAAVASAAYVFRDELSALFTSAVSGWKMLFNELAGHVQGFGDGMSAVFVRVTEMFRAFTQGLSNFLETPFADNNFQVLEDNLEIGFRGAFSKAYDAAVDEARKGNRKLKEETLEAIGSANGVKQTPKYIFDKAGAQAAMDASKVAGATPQTATEVLLGDKGTKGNVKEISKSIGDANTESNELLDYFKDMNSETRQLNNHISDVFANFVTGSMSAKEGLRSIAQEMISLASRSLFGGSSSGGIAGALFGAAGSLFSGGFGSAANSLGQSIGSIFSSSPVGPYKLPGFANGGSMVIGGNAGVDKNLLSLNNKPIARVGRGETLSVNPNSTGQEPIVVNQTINLSTGVQQTVRAEVMRMLPQIQQVTTSGVEDARMRGAFA